MATTSTQIRADNLPRSVPCTESGATRDAAARFDIVIVGSGGGAVTAALVAKARGLRPVIIEKRDKFGGSTAYSGGVLRSEEHTSELQSLMRISYAVFCLKKKNKKLEYKYHVSK